MPLKKAIAIIILVLLIDQISKIYIKTNFYYGEEVRVFEWFRIHFIENNGMAWGAEFGGKKGKLFLTIFRLFAITGIGYWLYSSIKKNAHIILVIAVSLIFAGALGNIIDSVFYGVIFNTPGGNQLATLFAEDTYGTIFHGKVVDMFYFPMWHGDLPSWIPYFGGKPFTFFNAIFNVADSAISIGVLLLILFSKKAFPKEEDEKITA
ncbi:lipoprotein signal peptidase [Lutibacter sp. TH_r2]|uniref:lipoprotein signal peptidase n=1 Tax=Lutibacter sp. TH_r2 TaxID=3082083 RepID=UPI002952BC5B|nr:lipoprotein signal peptidase [Lutibacter sp. TH_r2]MDV7186296.1 lipoprotein signal peptidase [Lutibacter sp. TH_r2]